MNHSWVGNSNQPAAGPECSVEELYPAGGEEGGEERMEGEVAHRFPFASLTLSCLMALYQQLVWRASKTAPKTIQLLGIGTFTH